MSWMRRLASGYLLAWLATSAAAKDVVVELQPRPGITERALYVEPETKPRAAAVLLPGGHGALKIYPNGSLGWGDRGFLVRTRELFAAQGIAVLVPDAPSDRRNGLGGFRDTTEHAADIAAAIAWLRVRTGAPVWLIGHSRGTESAVSAALQLGAAPKGPDGLVLAAAILTDSAFAAGKSVPQFPIAQLNLPLLVLHHDADACSVTAPADLPRLLDKLPGGPRTSVLRLSGGRPLGDLCGHEGYHGFGGLDAPAVQAITEFMQKP